MESGIFGCSSTKKEVRGETAWGVGRWFVDLFDFSSLAQIAIMTFIKGDTAYNFCNKECTVLC